jgi:hypothetical protein
MEEAIVTMAGEGLRSFQTASQSLFEKSKRDGKKGAKREV